MENFGSYLELMTAFNFAYVLGRDFFRELMVKAIGLSREIDKELSTCLIDANEVFKNMQKFKIPKDSMLKEEAYDKSIISFNSIINDFKGVEKERKEVASDLVVPVGFSELCFLSGLAAMLIILINSHQQSQTFPFDQCLMASNCFCMVYSFSYLLFFLITFSVRNYEPVARFIDKFGNVIVLCLMGIIGIFSLIMACSSDDTTCGVLGDSYYSDLSMYLISIVLWFHFLFYLVTAMLTANKVFKPIKSKLDLASKRFETLKASDYVYLEQARLGTPTIDKGSSDAAV